MRHLRRRHYQWILYQFRSRDQTRTASSLHGTLGGHVWFFQHDWAADKWCLYYQCDLAVVVCDASETTTTYK